MRYVRLQTRENKVLLILELIFVETHYGESGNSSCGDKKKRTNRSVVFAIACFAVLSRRMSIPRDSFCVVTCSSKIEKEILQSF